MGCCIQKPLKPFKYQPANHTRGFDLLICFQVFGIHVPALHWGVDAHSGLRFRGVSEICREIRFQIRFRIKSSVDPTSTTEVRIWVELNPCDWICFRITGIHMFWLSIGELMHMSGSPASGSRRNLPGRLNFKCLKQESLVVSGFVCRSRPSCLQTPEQFGLQLI